MTIDLEKLVPEPSDRSFNKKKGYPKEFIVHLGEVFANGVDYFEDGEDRIRPIEINKKEKEGDK